MWHNLIVKFFLLYYRVELVYISAGDKEFLKSLLPKNWTIHGYKLPNGYKTSIIVNEFTCDICSISYNKKGEETFEIYPKKLTNKIKVIRLLALLNRELDKQAAKRREDRNIADGEVEKVLE